MDALKRSILDVIEEPHLANFATVTEDGKPWVRYVMPKGSEDLAPRFVD
jgi:pyridoxine/pyridoxamine 5'-phosphate oxidase